jgi:IS1 family transposase
MPRRRSRENRRGAVPAPEASTEAANGLSRVGSTDRLDTESTERDLAPAQHGSSFTHPPRRRPKRRAESTILRRVREYRGSPQIPSGLRVRIHIALPQGVSLARKGRARLVAKKQSRLSIEEKALRHDIGDCYLWYGVDQQSKLVPAFLCGKRSGDNARRFMRQLASRITFPQPNTSGVYQPGQYRTVIQISTDGFSAYPEAVEQFFGIHARFGTIIKEYKNARMKYDPSEIVGTKRRSVFNLTGKERSICTSHIERCNLTVRTFMKRFTRLALGFSRKLECLEWAVTLHMAYYNFVWQPRTLPDRMTPAQAAGLANRPWSFAELMGR